MRVYHLTPEKNLKTILKEGLKIGKERHFTSPIAEELISLGIDTDERGIFLGSSPEECYDYVSSEDNTKYCLLSIDLLDNWIKVNKTWNNLYTVKDISPEFIVDSKVIDWNNIDFVREE